MHTNRIINAFNCINNHVNSCIKCMLSMPSLWERMQLVPTMSIILQEKSSIDQVMEIIWQAYYCAIGNYRFSLCLLIVIQCSSLTVRVTMMASKYDNRHCSNTSASSLANLKCFYFHPHQIQKNDHTMIIV